MILLAGESSLFHRLSFQLVAFSAGPSLTNVPAANAARFSMSSLGYVAIEGALVSDKYLQSRWLARLLELRRTRMKR